MEVGAPSSAVSVLSLSDAADGRVASVGAEWTDNVTRGYGVVY